MDITLTTPALLFPAISLLMVAYTNRFLTIASRIRNLHERYEKGEDGTVIIGQIKNLRTRVNLIRNMQAFGIISLFLCVLCMFVLFAGKIMLGKYIFGCSLLLLMISLALSFREVQISVEALNLVLRDMETPNKKNLTKRK
ncbi:MAG: DUF2721 domain-containing protein [Proteobacteria bacterium]|nr:DUF2721 domain-containing protein [Pseudomonadota bacterium]MBU1715091.1 DUF2721 domain-containing protein [Pseudomonadota bacterium]